MFKIINLFFFGEDFFINLEQGPNGAEKQDS